VDLNITSQVKINAKIFCLGFSVTGSFSLFFGSDAIRQIECEEATGFEFENEVILLITRIIV